MPTKREMELDRAKVLANIVDRLEKLEKAIALLLERIPEKKGKK